MSKFKPGDVVEVVDDEYMVLHGIGNGMKLVVSEPPRTFNSTFVFLKHQCKVPGECCSGEPGICGGWNDSHFRLVPPFKLGDRVKCIDTKENLQVSIGATGTVTSEIRTGTIGVKLDADSDREIQFFPWRFELVASKVDAATTGFTKHDDGKPRMDLLPPIATELEAKGYTHGAVKYGDNNWKKAKPEEYYRYLAAGLRHIFARMRGERLDPESKLPHLAHAVCCLKILLELEETENVWDKPWAK
jgi:hypothetical protein